MDYSSNPNDNMHPTTGKHTAGDAGQGIPATIDRPEHMNTAYDELIALITSSGQTANEATLDQIAKSVANYAANGQFYTDSGAANAYVLSVIGSRKAPTAYQDGAVFEFIVANDGTGAAATGDVAGLGVKNIKLPGGADPAAGQISGLTSVRYDLANDWLTLNLATELVAGISRFGAQAEVDAGVNDTLGITPKKLFNWVKQAAESVLGMAKVATQAQTDAGTNDATIVTPKKLLGGFSVLLAIDGYVVFPSWLGGLTIQWGSESGVADLEKVYFPLVFANAIFTVLGCDGTAISSPPGSIASVGIGSDDLQVNWFKVRTTSSTRYLWIAVGH